MQVTHSICLTIIKLIYKVSGFILLYNAIKDYITLAIFHMVSYSSLLDVYILSIVLSRKKCNNGEYAYIQKQTVKCV